MLEYFNDDDRHKFHVFLALMRLADWDSDAFFNQRHMLSPVTSQVWGSIDYVKLGLKRVEQLHFFKVRDDEVLQQIAQILYSIGDYEESRRLFEKVL